MINIEVNQEQLKELYIKKIDERLKEIEDDVFFMNSKQVLKVTGVSWNTFSDVFLSDPEFPVLRLGHRFLYPRKEVFAYLDKFYEAVRDNGGDIQKYVRK